ncbi:hypothetical protein DY000_02007157 [Brassica cretica]|uniref:Uncharacterized protein n=1 Tax=Brassica cretica TaxID=69181 RepID=A0ABQ7BYP0_BRACR|nr:hypothetical protein DY000_02007157 [Brassica cretica]
MARRSFLLPPVPQCDELEACSIIAIRPWSFPSSAFLQPQILVFGLEDDELEACSLMAIRPWSFPSRVLSSSPRSLYAAWKMILPDLPLSTADLRTA